MRRLLLAVLLLSLLALAASPAAGTGTLRGQGLFPELADTGRVRVEVLSVVEMEGAPVVLLKDVGSETIVPIWIGHSEAMSISLRLAGKDFQRPLTHDLLDAILRELGGTIQSVEVSSLEGTTYIAVLTLKKPDGVLVRLDARPSDSIALALGARAPIYVATKVVQATGVKQ